MKRKEIVIGCAMTVLCAGCILLLHSKVTSSSALATMPNAFGVARPGSTSASQPQIQIEQDYLVYSHLFSHLEVLDKRAGELIKQGRDGAKLRDLYKDAAKLSDEQSALVAAIGLSCQGDVRQQESKAHKIIQEFRGRLEKLNPGDAIPPDPPELKVLQKQRTQTVLRGRDRLHAALGEEEFNRFDAFIKKEVDLKVEKP